MTPVSHPAMMRVLDWSEPMLTWVARGRRAEWSGFAACRPVFPQRRWRSLRASSSRASSEAAPRCSSAARPRAQPGCGAMSGRSVSFSSSSRSRPLELSLWPFRWCLPGAMWCQPTPVSSAQLRMALEVNSVVQLPGHPAARQRGIRDHPQASARAVVHHRQDAETPPVGQLVGDEVLAPALLGHERRLDPQCACNRRGGARSAAPRGRSAGPACGSPLGPSAAAARAAGDNGSAAAPGLAQSAVRRTLMPSRTADQGSLYGKSVGRACPKGKRLNAEKALYPGASRAQ